MSHEDGYLLVKKWRVLHSIEHYVQKNFKIRHIKREKNEKYKAIRNYLEKV